MKKTSATARKGQAKARTAKSTTDHNLRYWEQSPVPAAVVLVVVVFACYANSLGNGFVFDDEFLVPAYGRAHGFSQLLHILFNSYRPVRSATYAIDFMIWGGRPFGFHLTNVLIHAANTVLAFLLIRRFAAGTRTAFLAALVFAVHPIQTDAVSYVSGRRDILFALFYLAAFHSYLSYRATRSVRFLVLFLGFWALGCLSKEMAITLPLVIFIWNFCEQWSAVAGSWTERSLHAFKGAFVRDKWLYTLLVVATVAFGGYTVLFKDASGRAGLAGLEYWGGSLYATVLTVMRVHAWYLKQLIYPTPIAQYFGAFDISTSLLEWRVVGAFVVVGTVLVAAATMLKKDRLMAFAVFAYFAELIPVSQIIPHHELLADHYLYLPILSFGLLVALAFNWMTHRGRQPRLIAYGMVAGYLLVLAGSTVSRNRDWKDELSVWEANYKSVPYSPRASYNLGGLYLIKDPEKAAALWRESIASDPGFEPAYLALAKLYVAQKRIPEAEELIQKGLDLINSKTRSFVLRNQPLLKSQFTTALAAAKWEAGEPQATDQLLREAVSLYPGNMSPYEALANLYHNQDRGKEIDVLKLALTANPGVYDIRARLAALAIERSNYDEAQDLLREMADLIPTDGDCEKARPYLTAVKAGVPNSMEQKQLSETVDLVLRQCVQR